MGQGTDPERKPVRLFSYVVAHDRDFAPNPFFGYCTPACCKPAIRRTATKGDRVVGLTPKAKGSRIVYVMGVTEKLSFDEYGRGKRFRTRREEDRGRPAILGRGLCSSRGEPVSVFHHFAQCCHFFPSRRTGVLKLRP